MSYYYPYYTYLSAVNVENALRRSRLASEIAAERVATQAALARSRIETSIAAENALRRSRLQAEFAASRAATEAALRRSRIAAEVEADSIAS